VTGAVRVLLFHRAEDAAGLERAYHEVSGTLAGVPGLLGNELWASVHDPLGFVVASSWESLDAFEVWERGADHRRDTASLRPYRDRETRTPFGVYRVLASHS
jgi:heme-degrading monooxygenase HmoA